MRNGIIAAGIAFAIALAYIIGNRLSNEAMAVVVGAVCGISASIPVSIGLVIATSNNWGRTSQPTQVGYDYAAHRYAPQPPVYIISPPANQAPMPYGFPQNQYYFPTPVNNAPREFKMIGED